MLLVLTGSVLIRHSTEYPQEMFSYRNNGNIMILSGKEGILFKAMWIKLDNGDITNKHNSVNSDQTQTV